MEVGVKGTCIREALTPNKEFFFTFVSCVFYFWLKYMHAARAMAYIWRRDTYTWIVLYTPAGKFLAGREV